MKKTIVVVAVLFFAACAVDRLTLPDDRALKQEDVSKIKKGKTTKAEVEAIFGAPLDSVVLEGGERYYYKDFNLRVLYVEFGRDGVVTDFNYDH